MIRKLQIILFILMFLIQTGRKLLPKTMRRKFLSLIRSSGGQTAMVLTRFIKYALLYCMGIQNLTA